jgi:HAD superfamily hydrolase (TIGR01549 family)
MVFNYRAHALENIRGFIFDLDGTLVTSSLDFLAIKSEIGCPTDEDVLIYIEQLPTVQQRSEAMDIVHRHEMQDAQSCDWIPGARDFLNECATRALPMAIVTRNSQRSSKVKVEKNNIPIKLLLTRENSIPKPHPAALLDIAREFQLPVDQMMMVGDYKYDLEAGRNANMPSCLVNFSVEPDYLHLADYRFRDFRQLHQAMFAR